MIASIQNKIKYTINYTVQLFPPQLYKQNEIYSMQLIGTENLIIVLPLSTAHQQICFAISCTDNEMRERFQINKKINQSEVMQNLFKSVTESGKKNVFSE